MPAAAYVHVPFCIHRCGYCDFTVIAGRDDLMGSFVNALQQELQHTLGRPHPVQTLFIGGGTPSYLPAANLKQLLKLLREWLPLEPGGEFSAECNPEQFTPDRMDALLEAGVNRVSLGVQSFDARHLRTLERTHQRSTVQEVVRQLRERGLDNLSFDLIFGIPGQSQQNWQATLEEAIALGPQHISTYGLTYEKGTSFWTRRAKQQLQPVAEELERDMYAQAMTRLPAAGYEQYELSNFARSGFECRHNQTYWAGEAFYGFGPGAAALIDGVRTVNHRSVTTWLKKLRQGESGVQEREDLSDELRAREAVMLGLRQSRGIEIETFRQSHGREIRQLAPEAYQRFIESGFLEETDGAVRLSREGRFIADSVMLEFL